MTLSVSRRVDEVVNIEIRGKLGFFTRSPTAYLRQLGVSDESIVAAMKLYGPKTAIRAADAAKIFESREGKEAARYVWPYLMEALDLGSEKGIPLYKTETVTNLVDKLYKTRFGIS